MDDRRPPFQDHRDADRHDAARLHRRFDALIDELRLLKRAGPDADPQGARRWTLLAELGVVMGVLGDLARGERLISDEMRAAMGGGGETPAEWEDTPG